MTTLMKLPNASPRATATPVTNHPGISGKLGTEVV
jgi:hypothetical protein